MLKLFELRACWTEYYDCPENGKTCICDTYDTIAFAIDDDSRLQSIAALLRAGYHKSSWSNTRSKALHKLYPGYDDFRDTTYVIVDVTDKILNLN